MEKVIRKQITSLKEEDRIIIRERQLREVQEMLSSLRPKIQKALNNIKEFGQGNDNENGRAYLLLSVAYADLLKRRTAMQKEIEQLFLNQVEAI